MASKRSKRRQKKYTDCPTMSPCQPFVHRTSSAVPILLRRKTNHNCISRDRNSGRGFPIPARDVSLTRLHRRFDFRDFLEPFLVPAAFKLGRQPNFDEAIDESLAEHVGREAKHVQIVMP